MSGPVSQVGRQTFRKLERLVSRKMIERLVQEGRSIQQPPFRLIWKQENLPGHYPVQIAFSVPKRNFKLAVQRNRIKRMMREVYRKNKSTVYTLLLRRKEQVAMLLIFTGKTLPEFKEVDQKLTLTLLNFTNEIQQPAV